MAGGKKKRHEIFATPLNTPKKTKMFMFIFKLDLVKWLPVALDLDDLIGKINKGESTKSRKLKIQRSWFIGYF